MRRNSIYLSILVPTHLPIRNGGKEMNLKMHLRRQTWIADNGAGLQGPRGPGGLSSQRSTMTDFVCGPANFRNIRCAKASGWMEKAMYSKNYRRPAGNMD